MPRRRPRRVGGRPSKFTAEAALAIVADVAGGRSRDEAARAAGVGPSTLYRWLQRGRAGDPRFASLARAIWGAENGAKFGEVLARMALFGKGRF